MAFDETWLVAVTRKRLAGEAPKLVPGASLAAVGGKLLLHHGGAEEKGAARRGPNGPAISEPTPAAQNQLLVALPSSPYEVRPSRVAVPCSSTLKLVKIHPEP